MMSWFREQLLYKYNSAYSISLQNPANPPIFPLATLLCMAYGMDKLRCRSIRHANFSLVSPTEPNATRPPLSARSRSRAKLISHATVANLLSISGRTHTHTHTLRSQTNTHDRNPTGPICRSFTCMPNYMHASCTRVVAQPSTPSIVRSRRVQNCRVRFLVCGATRKQPREMKWNVGASTAIVQYIASRLCQRTTIETAATAFPHTCSHVCARVQRDTQQTTKRAAYSVPKNPTSWNLGGGSLSASPRPKPQPYHHTSREELCSSRSVGVRSSERRGWAGGCRVGYAVPFVFVPVIVWKEVCVIGKRRRE